MPCCQFWFMESEQELRLRARKIAEEKVGFYVNLVP